MLRLAPNHLKTKRMCTHAVKKLPFVIAYVPDRYKAQGVCDTAILKNGGTLKSAPDSYKNKKCVINVRILLLL